MLFDIPGRPHTENLCNCKETAPDRIGEVASNLHNTRLRYELIPYLYSLAHRAHRFGEPVMPPPILYYQTDDRLRHEGDHKLIGRDLLAAVSTRYGEDQLDVYLPAGAWYDWHGGQRLESPDGLTTRVALHRDGHYTLPLYAREGAIIPVHHVDVQTGNALGMRRDGSDRSELMARVFAGPEASEFTRTSNSSTLIRACAGSRPSLSARTLIRPWALAFTWSATSQRSADGIRSWPSS